MIGVQDHCLDPVHLTLDHSLDLGTTVSDGF